MTLDIGYLYHKAAIDEIFICLGLYWFKFGL